MRHEINIEELGEFWKFERELASSCGKESDKLLRQKADVHMNTLCYEVISNEVVIYQGNELDVAIAIYNKEK